MYTGYLFILAFAILVTNAVCDDKFAIKSDGKTATMSTHELCTKAGFVRNTTKPITTNTKYEPKTFVRNTTKPITTNTKYEPKTFVRNTTKPITTNTEYEPKTFVRNTTKPITTNTKYEPKTAASTKMYTGNIILIVLGVTAGGLILAFAGHYFYNKQKEN